MGRAVTAARCPGPPAIEPLRLVRATPAMLPDVLSVLSDAARWLRVEKRIRQWPMLFAPGERRAVQLAGEAERGHVWLVYRDDTPLATVTVTPWCDPDFAHGWPGGPADALYVLRLAATTAARREHLQLGAALLEHAADVAAARGVSRLRLDCPRNNPRLHTYYEQHGFTRAGEVVVAHRRSGALFERAIPAGRPSPPERSGWKQKFRESEGDKR